MRWRPHTEAVDDRRMQGRSQPAAPSSEPPTGLNDPRDFHTRDGKHFPGSWYSRPLWFRVSSRLKYIEFPCIQHVCGPCNSFHCLGHSKNVCDDNDDDDDAGIVARAPQTRDAEVGKVTVGLASH